MITVSMDGVKGAVDTVREIIIPWRRQNAARIAKLENALREAEIQRINAETLIAKARADREHAASNLDRSQGELNLSQAKKAEAESALILAQVEKTKTEAEKERAILRQSQIGLAIQIVEKYASNLDEAQKMDYIIRLLQVLNRLLSSDVELG